MKKCKQGYYYCYTDKVCKPIPKGLRVTARFSGGGKEPEETGIGVPTNDNGDGNGDGNGGDGGGGMSEGSLRKWFKGSESKDEKPGWVNVLTGGTCASDEPGEGVPKCVSRSKYDSMTKAERKSAARRKKTADSGQQEKSGGAKPTYVSTDKPKKKMKKEEVEIIEGKDKKGKGSGTKDACYHKVKSRYSVWPSAYASGALVKCRKKGAANWGNKSESVEFSNWRDDFQATEYEFIDIIKAEPLISEASFEIGHTSADVRKAKTKKKIRDRTKTNDEGSNIAKKKLKGPSLPMEEVETVEEGQKCWKGYVKKGTKKMFGKTYNNCVKKEEFVDEAKDDTDIGEKTGKKVPRQNISDANRHKMEKRRRDNLKKRPGDVPGDSKLIQALRSKAKETGNYAEEKEESKVGGGNLKKLVAKAVRRVDADVDGDVDTDDMKSSETGEFVPSPDGKKKLKPKVRFEDASDWRSELGEAIDKSKMKCNSPKSQPVGDSQTGKSHVVKACEGGKEKIIRFGQRGVKGSPKKEGESKEYASRRNKFKKRHAKNISIGKMSAAYWSDKVKW